MTPAQPRYVSAGPDKAFGATVRARVHAHFQETGKAQKADGRIVLKVVAMLALFLVPLILILAVPMLGWAALSLAMVMGIGMAGVGMGVMHDGLHGAISKKTWVNEWLGGTMYLLGSDAFTWKVQHNGKHHTHTNVDVIDQDIDPPALLRFSEHAPLKKVHRGQHVFAFFFYGLLTLVKLGNDFFSLAKVKRSGDPRHGNYNYPLAFAAMVGVKVAHITLFIVLPILFTPFAWWQVILGFLLMHFTCGVILGTVFQLAHLVEGAQQPIPDANGIIATDWAVHEILTTADFAPRNKFITWFTGGLNFQIEHHLFPYISHLHYPEIAPIVQRTAEEHGLHYNVKPTMRKAMRSHMQRLWDLGHIGKIAQ
ncbi:MAG: acyl-CoA desaturase [Flavobacteriales bacterium]|nr:acyl-CoA desaturase [Flavobacteriales bacterium]MCC6938752.1 acyl-CoA desaturase [Flavobacteriales bacterium]